MIQFLTLLTINVTHSYYAGACEDIGFIVPADLARQLRRGRMLSREIDGTFYVLFEAGDDGKPIVSLAGRTLRIGLQLLNPYFTNFTQVDADFSSALSLYRNAAPATALNAVVPKPTLVGPVFSHALADNTKPISIVIKGPNGSVVQTDNFADAKSPLATSYDLTGLPTGLYTVVETSGAGTKSFPYYVDSELFAARVFGVLELTLDAGYYTKPAAFTLSFAAKQQTLNYYIVGTNYSDNDLKAVSIQDGVAAGPGRPIQFNPIILADTGPYSATADIPANLLNSGGGNVGLIQSATKVARVDTARTKLQLVFKKNGGTETLVANLPQPAPDKASADLIISISK